jgi:hypothetical protein
MLQSRLESVDSIGTSLTAHKRGSVAEQTRWVDNGDETFEPPAFEGFRDLTQFHRPFDLRDRRRIRFLHRVLRSTATRKRRGGRELSADAGRAVGNVSTIAALRDICAYKGRKGVIGVLLPNHGGPVPPQGE